MPSLNYEPVPKRRAKRIKRVLACGAIAMALGIHECFGPVMGWYDFRGWTKDGVVRILGTPEYDSRNPSQSGSVPAGVAYILVWRYGLGNGVRLDFNAAGVVVNEVQLQH
jgi:hypothetical protein